LGWVILLVSLLANLFASFFLSGVVDRREDLLFRAEVERRVARYRNDMKAMYLRNTGILDAMVGLYTSQPNVDYPQFSAFVAKGRLLRGNVRALGWLPWIKTDQRRAFEERAGVWLPGFRIREFDARRKVIVSPKRDAYVPMSFVFPMEGNRALFGMNALAHPACAGALKRARDFGDTTATGRMTLTFGGKKQGVYLLFSPVYDIRSSLGSVAERRRSLRGFVMGMFLVGMMKASFDRRAKGLVFRLSDPYTSLTPRLLWESQAFGKQPAVHEVRKSIKIGGRSWVLQARPLPALWQSYRPHNGNIVLWAGLCYTFLFGLAVSWYLLSLARSHTMLERESEQRQRTEEELLLAQQFALVASHDLKAPLRNVAGFLQLLTEFHSEQLDEEGEECILFAKNGVLRMEEMIDGLLVFARIETSTEERSDVDMTELVASMIEQLRPQIEEADAIISVGVLPRLKVEVMHIERLFQNLLTNAIKFRQKGEKPVISISVMPEGEHWLFQVADNGIGIPEAEQKKVFQMFRRLNPLTRYPGTGMGLAICQKIVERHGGTIWLTSTPDEGTTCHFTLPKSR
jgi:signal transduction histidine kinase